MKKKIFANLCPLLTIYSVPMLNSHHGNRIAIKIESFFLPFILDGPHCNYYARHVFATVGGGGGKTL